MDGIYLEYSFLHMLRGLCSYSHIHKIVIPINGDSCGIDLVKQMQPSCDFKNF